MDSPFAAVLSCALLRQWQTINKHGRNGNIYCVQISGVTRLPLSFYSFLLQYALWALSTFFYSNSGSSRSHSSHPWLHGCMFLLSETLYSSVKYFKNIYKIIIRSDAIVNPRAADAYTVWHGHNKSAHHKATWAQLTCTGVGGRTCLGLRAAGSQSAFLDSSGQLLDLLGYTMKQPPDTALSVELSFSLGHRDCRSQTQSIWSTSNG